MIGTMSLVFLVPMIGLGIDVGFMLAVKSKLQASMDGATLGAARALNIGQTTAAQAVTAEGHAVNWFNANFPTGYFGTYNTAIDVNLGSAGKDAAGNGVFDDPVNPHLRHVHAYASTTVDAFFMRWFGYTSTTIGVTSDATRRDAVIMLVLDRSGSMNTSGACPSLISAAKLFTGQFAAGRDYIGAVSFSDGTYVHSAPSTNFQTVLGYTNDGGSSAGQLDSIQCNGGTGTPQAIAVAYDALYKMNLPGALNILMIETDGLPNTMTLNWWDNNNLNAGIVNGSNCTDMSGKKKSAGGFATKASLPNWTTGYTMTSSYYTSVPAGIVGALYSGDPWQAAGGSYFAMMSSPWQAGANTGDNSIWVNGSAPGCTFNGGFIWNSIGDLAWAPLTDVYGNQLNPGTNPYQGAVNTITSGGGTYLSLAGGGNNTTWTNYHHAVLNATDNAAYQARSNGTISTYNFVIGLGGNCTPSCTAAGRTGDPPDNVLLQRIANDPNGDLFNTPATYQPCSQEATCVNYSGQPQGTYIFSSDHTKLVQAFLSISSQILRLSR